MKVIHYGQDQFVAIAGVLLGPAGQLVALPFEISDDERVDAEPVDKRALPPTVFENAR